MKTTVSIEVPEKLGVANRLAFRDAVMQEIEAYERVVLDASRCDNLDPLGLGTLLTICRLVKSAGHEFTLRAAADSQPEVTIRTLHFERLLNVEYADER